MEKNNVFESFINRIFSFPLWVKEILYLQLKENLEATLVDSDINAQYDDVYQFYIPQISFKGKKEFSDREHSHDINTYKFLEGVSQGLSIIEITLNNFWTLEEISKIFTDCIEREYIAIPSSNIVIVTSFYLSSKIRLGEYFKRLGKISLEQLDQALRKQKETQDAGQKLGIATILIQLGYISEQDTKNLLVIKEESRKRFIFTMDVNTSSMSETEDVSSLQQSIKQLTNENQYLKSKLREIYNQEKENAL